MNTFIEHNTKLIAFEVINEIVCVAVLYCKGSNRYELIQWNYLSKNEHEHLDDMHGGEKTKREGKNSSKSDEVRRVVLKECEEMG